MLCTRKPLEPGRPVAAITSRSAALSRKSTTRRAGFVNITGVSTLGVFTVVPEPRTMVLQLLAVSLVALLARAVKLQIAGPGGVE